MQAQYRLVRDPRVGRVYLVAEATQRVVADLTDDFHQVLADLPGRSVEPVVRRRTAPG